MVIIRSTVLAPQVRRWAVTTAVTAAVTATPTPDTARVCVALREGTTALQEAARAG
jgi:hypothetical protein